MKRVVRSPILKLLVAVGLLLPLVGAPASPVAADHGPLTSGTVNLLGLITFSKFPCKSMGETTCIGLLKGSWYGGFVGRSGNANYNAHWRTDETEGLTGGQVGTTTAPMHSVFWTYDPLCTPTADVAGLADGYGVNGSGSAAAAGPSEITTGEVVYDDGSTASITSVSITYQFGFMRTGAGLTFEFSNVRIVARPEGRPEIVMVDSPQVGKASFVPEDPGYRTGLPGCNAPLERMEARTDVGLTINHPSDFMP